MAAVDPAKEECVRSFLLREAVFFRWSFSLSLRCGVRGLSLIAVALVAAVVFAVLLSTKV